MNKFKECLLAKHPDIGSWPNNEENLVLQILKKYFEVNVVIFSNK